MRIMILDLIEKLEEFDLETFITLDDLKKYFEELYNEVGELYAKS